jgi:hypothetical protein
VGGGGGRRGKEVEKKEEKFHFMDEGSLDFLNFRDTEQGPPIQA